MSINIPELPELRVTLIFEHLDERGLVRERKKFGLRHFIDTNDSRLVERVGQYLEKTVSLHLPEFVTTKEVSHEPQA